MCCLKCGKETSSNQAFCEHCLEGMSNYPVKPDTVITLPHRPATDPQKKQASRKRVIQPEEQLAAMHRLIRRLIAALVVVTVLFALSAAGFVYTYKNNENTPAVGRNYTIDPGRRP